MPKLSKRRPLLRLPAAFVFSLGFVITLTAVDEAGRAGASAQATVSQIPIEAADRFDDGIAAVNAPLCKNPRAFGPLQDADARAGTGLLIGLSLSPCT